MTSAPSWRRASARSSSRRTKARTLCPLASSISVRLRPMEPTAPPAPVTRIGLACDDCVEPISKSFEEHNEAGKLDKAEEIVGVVLPTNEDPALPLKPGEEALDEPASHVAA